MENEKILKVMAILGTIIAIIALIYGVFKLYTINKAYDQVDKTYGTIQDICIDESSTIDNNSEVEQENSTKTTFTVNWQELQEINQDAVAWIKIDDTTINYPIVQGTDNEKYVKNDINGNSSKGGCIFVNSEILNPFNNLNTIVYGHNLNDGSMFNNLKNYSDEEYAKKHNEIHVYLPHQYVKTYKVFAFCKVNWNNREIYNTSVDNLEDYYNKIQKYNKINIVDNIDYSKPVIALSTCTNNYIDERCVVFAYLDM